TCGQSLIACSIRSHVPPGSEPPSEQWGDSERGGPIPADLRAKRFYGFGGTNDNGAPLPAVDIPDRNDNSDIPGESERSGHHLSIGLQPDRGGQRSLPARRAGVRRGRPPV